MTGKGNDIGIGILGCSYIAPLSIVEPASKIHGLYVAGVAGRNPERAKSYAKEHAINSIFTSYEALINSKEIDLIYIALPPILQGNWVKRSLEAGKHVLVEKPMSLVPDEAKAMANLAEAHRLHLLEGIMVQHHPWQERIHYMIHNNEFGKLCRIHTRICSEFGELSPTNFRRFPDLGGGVFYDEAPYWLQFVQRLLGLSCLTFKGQSSFCGPRGLDWTFDAALQFIDGIEVTCFFSYEHPREASHSLYFENATVEIKNFFRPAFGNYKFRININFSDGKQTKELFAPQNYYENQLRFLTKVIQGERENLPIANSVERIDLTKRIMDSALLNHCESLQSFTEGDT